jgi:small subunit ribosomal protein S21
VIRLAIRTGESPEKFLQRFKRMCSKEGLLKEIKKRSYYEKPSEKRRRRVKEQKKAIRKKARMFSKKKS